MNQIQIFKDISPDDYNITPFTVNKRWTFTTSDCAAYNSGDWGIQVVEGILNSSDTNDGISKGNIYNLINNLYYNSSNGDYNNYSTIDSEISLNLDNQFWLISVPQQMLGEGIKPRTVNFISGSNWDIRDDGHGNLYDYANPDRGIIGNVFYEQCNIVLTHTSSYCGTNFNTGSDWVLSLNGIHTIYEHEVICNIKENEFRMTTNTTAFTSSLSSASRIGVSVIPGLPLITSGSFLFTVAGSTTTSNEILFAKDEILYDETWDPYITTIGLYNDDYELIAVGKLASPIQNKKDEELNIVIQWDL